MRYPVGARAVTVLSTEYGKTDSDATPTRIGCTASTSRSTKRSIRGLRAVVVAVKSSQSRRFPPAYASQRRRLLATASPAMPLPVLVSSHGARRPKRVTPFVTRLQSDTWWHSAALVGAAANATEKPVRASASTGPWLTTDRSAAAAEASAAVVRSTSNAAARRICRQPSQALPTATLSAMPDNDGFEK